MPDLKFLNWCDAVKSSIKCKPSTIALFMTMWVKHFLREVPRLHSTRKTSRCSGLVMQFATVILAETPKLKFQENQAL